MAEHFNISLILSGVADSTSRLDTVLSLRDIYSSLFGDIQEVSLDNYKTTESVREGWPKGEALVKTGANIHELLFVYGNKLGWDGSRSSIHIDQNGFCEEFLISLPLKDDADLSDVESLFLATKDFAESISNSFVLAAGWEFECEISEKIDDVLLGALSDDSLCMWAAFPKQLISGVPERYSKVSESASTMLLSRV
ncbi:hypothetical protein [Burkholderia arboris]|uniref:hypothetical protein n=1 Tax=Burkholderia arboris TaxID=488730 RepID=UPI001583F8A4|nr:hypothetical protein [Burkholderia arboris]